MIKKLEADLKDWLSKSSIPVENIRIGVLGVGSELRGDDYVGVLIAERIKEQSDVNNGSRITAFMGHTAPESITGEIIAFKPTHLIIVDAAELNSQPGTVKVLSADDIEGIAFSTHQLPMSIVVSYLVYSCHCDVTIIGIQPESLTLMKEPSPAVMKTAEEVISVILKMF